MSAVGGVTMTPCCGRTPGLALVGGHGRRADVTTAIGLLQALVITKAGVPSFVVTLAGCSSGRASC